MDDGEIHSLCLELLTRPSAGAGSPDGGELCVLHPQLLQPTASCVEDKDEDHLLQDES